MLLPSFFKRSALTFCLVMSVFCALFFWAENASALPVALDCYLPNGPVDCQDLQNAFFQGGLFKHDEEHPDLRIRLRAQRVQASIKILFHFKGTLPDAPIFEMQDWQPASLEKDAVVLRIISSLQRGSAPFLDAESAAMATVSGLELKLYDAKLSASVAPEANPTLWYISPRLWGNMSSEGLFRLGAGASLSLNWSAKKWRIRSSSGVFYRALSTETDASQVLFERLALAPLWQDDDNNEEVFYDAFSAWHATTLVHSLHKGVSVGSRFLVARDPRDNQAFLVRPQVGAEWLWQDFLKSDGTNFGFRYQIGGEFVYFERMNALKHDREYYSLHSFEAFAALHFGRLDVNLGAGAKSQINNLKYSSIFGNLNITWRITDALLFTSSTSGAFRNGIINAPLEPSSNSLEAFAGGSNFGELTYRMNFSLSYTFGNALLRSQDQRWRLGN